MNYVSETPLHAGPETDRAINKTDFFRLFKSITKAAGFEYFIVLRHTDKAPRLEPGRHFLLTSFPDPALGAIANLITDDSSRIPTKMSVSTLPFVANLNTDAWIPGLERGQLSLAFVQTFYASDGKRYGFIMFGNRPHPNKQEFAEIIMDSMRVFNRFSDRFLAQEMSTQLTSRELDVVRWTSEGKTSAEIAIILGLSEHTIISHITACARKLSAVNRVHMIAIAIRQGLVY